MSFWRVLDSAFGAARVVPAALALVDAPTLC